MKGNSLPIWHRCGTCGTIVGNLQELRWHLEKHTASKRWPERVDPQKHTNSADMAVADPEVEAELKEIGRVHR